jgi:hypothetical protein
MTFSSLSSSQDEAKPWHPIFLVDAYGPPLLRDEVEASLEDGGDGVSVHGSALLKERRKYSLVREGSIRSEI